MTIARVQEKSAVGLSTSLAVTFSGASTAGNLLIAVVEVLGGTVTAPSGFSTAISNSNVNGNPVYIFYYPNAPSQTTITATANGLTQFIMFIAEYSGINPAITMPLFSTATGTISTGATPSGTLTTAYQNQLIIVGLDADNSDTWSSPTNGFNLVDQQVNTGSSGCAYLDKFNVGPGSYSTSANNSSGGNGVIASFLSSPILGNPLLMQAA